jgi:hypothetical protein
VKTAKLTLPSTNGWGAPAARELPDALVISEASALPSHQKYLQGCTSDQAKFDAAAIATTAINSWVKGESLFNRALEGDHFWVT